jgi:hypothetical protein
MGFSLSVHNAAPGLYSIARHDRTPTTSIAANVDLAEAACFEALGCLLSGASQVLVVCCEDVVPPPYKEDGGHWEFRHAWACRLRLALSGCLSLEAAEAAGEPAAMPMEPPSLRALSFLAGARGRSLVSDTGRYVWRRHD